MVEALKQLLISQFEAALCTLNACIERCPAAAWDAPVANQRFCRVAFHTLFFTDVHLGWGTDSLREQPFHRAHPGFFRDYEELEDRIPVHLYDRPTTLGYMEHCREKVTTVITAETAEVLCGPSGFARRAFCRAELHVYNIRHIQHHAAQLSLRLRIDHREAIPWVGSRWALAPLDVSPDSSPKDQDERLA